MKKGDPVSIKEWLYRRSYCLPERKYCNPDGTATSRVFKLREKDNGRLSVDIKSLTTPEKCIMDSSKFILFEISNEIVEKQGLKTIHDPLDDGTNDAHALLIGMSMEDDVVPGILARKSLRVIF